ncbi:MAG: carbohydrate-binding domain-containing protein [Ruminococcus sp.]
MLFLRKRSKRKNNENNDKKKKSSKKKTTTKQKKETTAKVTTRKLRKLPNQNNKASKTTTAPRIAATMPRENLFRTTTVRNDTANAFIRTTKTSSKAESPASVKMTTLKTNVVIRTQPPVPVTIAPVETNPTQPEQQTDKYLSLSDGEMQGAGIVVSGNQIFLQAAGIYHLSGNWNGSICVQAGATDAIELRLEGASICGVDAPAIQIQQAGMVTIKTADHSENTILADQGVTAIDSSSALQLQGTGALQIQNESGNGITCTDAITITEGMLSIAAKDTAILSGRDSKILDGMVIANGGQSGIRCDGRFSVEGGTLLATGTNANIADHTQPTAQLDWQETITSGHTVSFQINGIEVVKTMLQYDAETFFLTCPDLTIGNNVDFLIDGINVKTFEQQEQDARWNEKE